MSGRRRSVGMYVVLLVLVVLHFAVAPWWPDRRVAPDLLLLALLIFSMRVRPGAAAFLGFAVGLVNDSITLVGFGAGAMAYTVVGYLAAWGRAVFFAENLIVNAAFFFVGSWFRDLLVLAAGGMSGGAIIWQLVWWSIWKGLSTAVAGVIVLVLFKKWINIRILD